MFTKLVFITYFCLSEFKRFKKNFDRVDPFGCGTSYFGPMDSFPDAKWRNSTALIHSVVALHISDQWTRSRMQSGEIQTVCGALLGKHSGRNIEISNSFELVTSLVAGKLTFDEDYYIQRSLLYKETFPDLDFLGFYTTCNDHEQTAESDVSLQRQAMRYSEAPFLLKFNAGEPVVCDKLSITVFDSRIDPADESRLIFQSVPIKVVNEPAEQIGLDHVARYSKASSASESTASKYLGAQFGAIASFAQGLAIAQDYVTVVQDGRIERDEQILREIHKLCLRLTTFDSKDGTEVELLQAADHKLLVLLSALTNVQGQMFRLVDRLNLLARERFHQERSSIIQHRNTHSHFLHSFGGAPFGRFF